MIPPVLRIQQLYGQPGDPIPDSAYYRAYCAGCGEPIRVAEKARALAGNAFCNDCKHGLQHRPDQNSPQKARSSRN